MTHDEKIVEAVARALCRRQIVANLRWGREDATSEYIQQCEDVGWQYGEWIDQARAAITAYQAEAGLKVANCCNCGRIIDTREITQGGDEFGCELSDGRWVCSPDCWDTVVEPPLPPAPKASP